mmetsp:Transcript_11253/g.25242  ORF Transcript_11253/g.25242 Transcript_11253/m.25242 type:complete len:137 (-) Transcript_11253:37-447(-)
MALPSASSRAFEGERSAKRSGCLLARSLQALLDEMCQEGRVPVDRADRLLRIFDEALEAEISQLPKYWSFRVKGKLTAFRINERQVILHASEAEAHAKDGIFYNVPLRITVSVPSGSRRTRVLLTAATEGPRRRRL